MGFRRTGEKRRSGGEEEMGGVEGDEDFLVTANYSGVWVPHARSGGEEEMGIEHRFVSCAPN